MYSSLAPTSDVAAPDAPPAAPAVTLLGRAPDAPPDTAVYPLLYREPAAARIIYRLIWLLVGVCFINLLLCALAFYLYQRRPERVVIKENEKGEQLLQIDNRSYGEVSKLALQPDRPTKGQLLFAAKEFTRLMYEVDLSVRPKQLERGLGMMLPGAAQTLFKYLKENTTLTNNKVGVAPQQERAESWVAQLDLKDVAQDARDPYQVNIIAEQHLRKNLNGQPAEATRQFQLTLKLQPDPTGRTDANLQTGFQIHSFTFKEIPQ